MVVSIRVPEEYGYVLLTSTVMAIFCHVLGFVMGGKGRGAAFGKEFMDNYFLETH